MKPKNIGHKLKTSNLKETFNYVDGGLYRLIPVRGSKVGSRFGGIHTPSGSRQTSYRRGRFNGKIVFEHRLVWEHFNGAIPNGKQVDHINHDGLDNRIENLRLTDTLGNSKNRPLFRNNKTGVCGVHYSSYSKSYVAQIKVSGKSTHLGQFDNIFDAAACRISASNKHNFHENHGAGG